MASSASFIDIQLQPCCESKKGEPAAAVKATVDKRVQDIVKLLPTEVSWATLPLVIVRAMEQAETYKKMSGAEKRQLVIESVNLLIERLGKNTELEVADPIFKALVPVLIDQLVTATKDGLQVNARVKTCFSWCCLL
jgi:hypothetical protein